MIRKMEVEDIAKIMYLPDPDFDKLFKCTLGEWVQFLVQNAGNEHFFIWGVFDGDVLTGYVVACFIPLPICKGVSVLYLKTAGLESNKEVLGKMTNWGREKGAASIDIITNNVIGYQVYGFKKSATVMGVEL